MTDLTPFIDLQRRSNRAALVVGVVISAFGGALSFIPSKGANDTLIKLGITGFFVAIGLVLIVLGLQSAENAAPIVALRDRPMDVVWIYVQRRIRNGQHIASDLKIGLVSGKFVALPIGVGREDELLALACARAPEARVGYDVELERTFKQNPGSLRT